MTAALGTIIGISVVAGALALATLSVTPATDPAPGPAAGTASGASSSHRRAIAYALPLAHDPIVVRAFDAPAATWAPGHRGVDLAGTVAQVVLAPTRGIVSFAGTVVDRGVVTITDPEGLRTTLEPVLWSVGAGTHVDRGDPVGRIQPVAGHCAPATCVHWGVRRGDTYLDPLTLVHPVGPVILLPDP